MQTEIKNRKGTLKRELQPFPEWMIAEIAEYAIEMEPGPRTILDIGANVGAYAIECSRRWPEAQIRCYEPVAENYAELQKNTAHSSKIHRYRFAVRGFNGRDKILLGDHGVTCGFYQLGRQTDQTEQVLCCDAGELPCAELVKIDTEGCEVEIVSRLNLAKTRALVVEYHRSGDVGILKTVAISAGFVLLEETHGSGMHGVLKFGRAGTGVTAKERKEHKAEAARLESVALPLKERRIYCAVASHFSNHDLYFLQSMMQLLLRAEVRMSFGWSCDPSVERARNVLTANFLETDCTHLLFIDSDIAFSPRDVMRIISHDEDVVGGIYPLKTMDREVRWCGNGANINNGQQSVVREDGLQEVGCVGTGFLCIARCAFERLRAAEGEEYYYDQDWPPHRREYAFWSQEVRGVNGHRRFLTEDWNFCYRFKEAAGKVFADTRVILRHMGRAVWPLELQNGNPFSMQRGEDAKPQNRIEKEGTEGAEKKNQSGLTSAATNPI